jgi:hypothetical protein
MCCVGAEGQRGGGAERPFNPLKSHQSRLPHVPHVPYLFQMPPSIRRQVEGSEEEIVVATTRLETMLGDTAVVRSLAVWHSLLACVRACVRACLLACVLLSVYVLDARVVDAHTHTHTHTSIHPSISVRISHSPTYPNQPPLSIRPPPFLCRRSTPRTPATRTCTGSSSCTPSTAARSPSSATPSWSVSCWMGGYGRCIWVGGWVGVDVCSSHVFVYTVSFDGAASLTSQLKSRSMNA